MRTHFFLVKQQISMRHLIYHPLWMIQQLKELSPLQNKMLNNKLGKNQIIIKYSKSLILSKHGINLLGNSRKCNPLTGINSQRGNSSHGTLLNNLLRTNLDSLNKKKKIPLKTKSKKRLIKQLKKLRTIISPHSQFQFQILKHQLLSLKKRQKITHLGIQILRKRKL